MKSSTKLAVLFGPQFNFILRNFETLFIVVIPDVLLLLTVSEMLRNNNAKTQKVKIFFPTTTVMSLKTPRY